MTHAVAQHPLIWLGLAGVPPDDDPRAVAWQKRLHWVMVVVALLSLPAYLLDTSGAHAAWHRFATVLDATIFVAFAAEMIWMARLSRTPLRYLAENWLNAVVILGSGAALLGATTEWIAMVRV